MGTIAIRAVVKRAIPSEGALRIYGWAALSRDAEGNPVIDADGDWIPVEEIEKAAQQALLDRGGRAAVGVNHEELNRGDLIESFVLTEAKQKAFGLENTPTGWMVGISTTDPKVINAVQSGALAEMSVRAQGRRKPLALPDGETWANILKRVDAPKTVNVVTDLRLREIELLSIVDKGAGGNEVVRPGIVLITKREGMQEDVKKRTVGAILADLIERGAFADAKLPPEEMEQLMAEVARMNAAEAQAAEQAQAAAVAAPPVQEMAMQADGEKKKDDVEKAEDEEKKDELAKRNVALERRVAELESAAAHSALVDMAKRDMAFLPGADVDEVATIIHEIRQNLAKSHAQKVETLLKSASAAIRKGGLLDATAAPTSGTAGGGELHELAKSLRAKNPELSAASALLEAGRTRPDLWNAHRKAR